MKFYLFLLTIILSFTVQAGTYEVKVPSMTCQSCVRNITSELKTLKEVRDVDINLSTKIVKIETKNPIKKSQVRKKIEEAGYSMTGFLESK